MSRCTCPAQSQALFRTMFCSANLVFCGGGSTIRARNGNVGAKESESRTLHRHGNLRLCVSSLPHLRPHLERVTARRGSGRRTTCATSRCSRKDSIESYSFTARAARSGRAPCRNAYESQTYSYTQPSNESSGPVLALLLYYILAYCSAKTLISLAVHLPLQIGLEGLGRAVGRTGHLTVAGGHFLKEVRVAVEKEQLRG